MSDRIYNCLKWIAITAIPAINVFLGAVLPVVGVDAETTKNILIIVAAVDTLLGTLIGVSSVNYAKKTEVAENGDC